MAEEETKKVNTESVTEVVPPPAPVPEAPAASAVDVPVAESEEPVVVEVAKDVVTVEEEAKPVAPETKKHGRFFGLWSKGKKKDAAVKTETPETPAPAAVPEPELEAPVAEAPKEEIEEKQVVPATETEDKPEEPTTPPVADAKKSAPFFKLPSLSRKKGHKKAETTKTPAVPEPEPELPVVAEAPKEEIEEKSVIVPAAREEKTEDPKPNADVAETKKSGGFFKLGSIKWPKTKKKESIESLPAAPVEESEAAIAESLKVEVDEKSIVPVEEEKAADDSKPVVVDDAKKVGGFFNLGSISWKKKHTKEPSEENIEVKKVDEGSNRDIVLTKAANEKTLTLIQAWEESEKAKAENKAEKKLSIIISAENSRIATVEAELKKIEEKLETIKAEYIEKLKNKEASIHKVAEEKRAAVEARRAEELLIAEETAAKYRAAGSAPKKLLLGYF